MNRSSPDHSLDGHRLDIMSPAEKTERALERLRNELPDNVVCAIIATNNPDHWYETVITEKLRAHCQEKSSKHFIVRELELLTMRIRSGEFDAEQD